MNAKILILSFVALLCLSGFSDPPVKVLDMQYSIDPGSNLTIAGTSNVNSFACLCNETFLKRPVKVTFIDSNSTMKFSNAILKLPTKSMDCSNSRMNSDLCDALKADQFPYIIVELHEVNLRSSAMKLQKGEWADVVAVATITITNVCKPIVMDVKVRKIGADKFRFMCSKDMKMTDFKVDPPTALFGLIKVHNEIKINLDLSTTVSGN